MSHLIAAKLGSPLDVVMSYSCLTLQNNALEHYLGYFNATGVGQIISASPLGNGLLTTRGPHDWHPAPEALRQNIKELATTVQASYHLPLERLALHHSLYFPHTVIGFSSIEEVKTALDVLEQVRNPQDDVSLGVAKAAIKDALKTSGFLDWSWPMICD